MTDKTTTILTIRAELQRLTRSMEQLCNAARSSASHLRSFRRAFTVAQARTHAFTPDLDLRCTRCAGYPEDHRS